MPVQGANSPKRELRSDKTDRVNLNDNDSPTDGGVKSKAFGPRGKRPAQLGWAVEHSQTAKGDGEDAGHLQRTAIAISEANGIPNLNGVDGLECVGPIPHGEDPEEKNITGGFNKGIIHSKQLIDLADQLSHSLVGLRGKLAELTAVANSDDLVNEGGKSANGGEKHKRGKNEAAKKKKPQRTNRERLKYENEIAKTERAIRDSVIASRAVERLLDMRTLAFSEVKEQLIHEIAELEDCIEGQQDTIKDGFAGRIALLKRYWEWRKVWERGEVEDGLTFEEELKRGPRYRSIGIQNNIRVDYMEMQMLWLKQLLELDETFRSDMRQLDALVQDLEENNDVIGTLLTCPLCGLFLEEPVASWPCGHTFCLECFDSLMVSPSLYRCFTCGSFGTEGFVQNILITETLAKWEFKDSGYADVHGAMNRVEHHMDKFRRDAIERRIGELQERMDNSTKESIHVVDLSDDSTDADM